MLEFLLGGCLLGCLIIYALTAGADFGGGVWDLCAFGPRAAEQRRLIAEAIAPIWEANHVWLIIAIVILFTGFPPVFAALSISLHVPLVLMLLGIVLRGSAFVFRSHETSTAIAQRRWSYVFSIPSLLTPFFLGTVIGAMASGSLRWEAPFSLAVGVLSVTLFAFLAAVYLTLETHDTALREDFRRRALGAGIILGVVAWGAFWLSRENAPRLHAGLVEQTWSLRFHLLTAIAAVGALTALVKRSYSLARMFAVAQTILILAGWGAAQYPYLIVPDLTLQNAAAPASVLKPLLIVLAVGGTMIAPAFIYLYSLFKRHT
jgi:cytochrome bd ubiquinol oxidase subunit II